jgi:hypothetical protein
VDAQARFASRGGAGAGAGKGQSGQSDELSHDFYIPAAIGSASAFVVSSRIVSSV